MIEQNHTSWRALGSAQMNSQATNQLNVAATRTGLGTWSRRMGSVRTNQKQNASTT